MARGNNVKRLVQALRDTVLYIRTQHYYKSQIAHFAFQPNSLTVAVLSASAPIVCVQLSIV
jgi:hypothetical protein